MSKKDFLLYLIHAVLGYLVFLSPDFSKLLSPCIVVISLIYIFNASNKLTAILICCAYVATSGVFLRMTGGLIFHELHKYLLILYTIIGIIFETRKIKGGIYFIYMLLLLSSIAYTDYSLEESPRRMIAFNLSGPISLGLLAFYTYGRKINFADIKRIFFWCLLPVISLSTYLLFYTPDIKSVIRGVDSNFETSGGFGPNQVATVLGVGVFILITRLVLIKKSLLMMVVELLVLAFITFRGLITFSRGGMITALIASIAFVVIVFLSRNRNYSIRLFKMLFMFFIVGLGVWLITLNQTSGMIEYRYTNKNAIGEERDDITTGRTSLIEVELEAFLENPFFGIGVGKNKIFREQRTGISAASHNEVSRLLAEHGLLGIFSFFILFFTPLFLRLKNRKNVFFYSCFVFWFLTINHTSMRIAFASFIYGMILLDVQYPTKNNSNRKYLEKLTIHRE